MVTVHSHTCMQQEEKEGGVRDMITPVLRGGQSLIRYPPKLSISTRLMLVRLINTTGSPGSPYERIEFPNYQA